MNDRITLGAAVLVSGVFLVRWALTPHRSRHVQAVADDALLADLMDDWPEPAMGAVVAQSWRWCAECMRMEPALLHADDCWRCGHCLTVTYAGTEAAS